LFSSEALRACSHKQRRETKKAQSAAGRAVRDFLTPLGLYSRPRQECRRPNPVSSAAGTAEPKSCQLRCRNRRASILYLSSNLSGPILPPRASFLPKQPVLSGKLPSFPNETSKNHLSVRKNISFPEQIPIFPL